MFATLGIQSIIHETPLECNIDGWHHGEIRFPRFRDECDDMNKKQAKKSKHDKLMNERIFRVALGERMSRIIGISVN